MGAIRAVLFDFGDTLFQRTGGSAAIQQAAETLGTTVAETRAAELWDSIQSKARTATELERGRDLTPEAHRECWIDLYSEADVVAPGMAELLYAFEIRPENWDPFPEVADVLQTLRAANIPVGVVSDTGWDIRSVFDAHGVEGDVDEFVLSCEMGAAKPEPALFLTACERLGVSPTDTLMVGDNPLTDGGAVRAGLVCLIVPPPQLRASGVLRLVPSLVGLALP